MKFTKRDLAPKSDNGSGLFIRLKDGESVTGVCRGEIYEFSQKWEGNKSLVVDSSDPDGKARFRVNMVVIEDRKFVAKIFEFGVTIYNQLADIAEEYEIEATKIKVTRRGQGTDTIYMVLPLLKEPISTNIFAEIESLKLNILNHKEPVKNYAPQIAKTGSDDGLPF